MSANGLSDNGIEQLAAVAQHHLQGGRVAEAIGAYQALLRLRPDQADDWYNLAYLQRCARHFEDALDAYQRALDLKIDRPEEVHLNRGAILSDHLGRQDEALSELRLALDANPAFLAAWLNLGQLHEDSGRPADARAAYVKAIAVNPANGRAHARLAMIDIFERQAERAIIALRGALRHPGIALEDVAEIWFALGHALDATARYDEAFAAFSTANVAARRIADPALAYKRPTQDRLIAQLIETFPVAVRRDGGGGLIFICGLFRSGSTLAEQILARHPRVTAGGELELLPAMVQDRLQPYPASLSAIRPEELDALAQTYLNDVAALYPGADIVTDKRPDNFLHIGLIKSLFPEAKIVHSTRNILDNILSIYFLHFADGVAYGGSLPDIAHYVGGYRTLMAHWKALYGDDIYDLDYDALVADPEPVVRSLLQFCELPWDAACLASTPLGDAVRTASNWQVRQPLHARSSGRWQHYEEHLAEIGAALDLAQTTASATR